MEVHGRLMKVLQNLMYKRTQGFFNDGGPDRAQSVHRETFHVFYPRSKTQYMERRRTWVLRKKLLELVVLKPCGPGDKSLTVFLLLQCLKGQNGLTTGPQASAEVPFSLELDVL